MGSEYNIALRYTILLQSEVHKAVVERMTTMVNQMLIEELKVSPAELGKWLGASKWNPFDKIVEVSRRFPHVRFEMWECHESMEGQKIWNICNGEYAQAKVVITHLSAEEIKAAAERRREHEARRAEEIRKVAEAKEKKRRAALGKLSDEEKKLLGI